MAKQDEGDGCVWHCQECVFSDDSVTDVDSVDDGASHEENEEIQDSVVTQKMVLSIRMVLSVMKPKLATICSSGKSLPMQA